MMNINIKLMLRRLLKEKTFALINVLGLGVGIACFLLIALYLQEELSYDRQFAKADRIYRVSISVNPEDGTPEIVVATNAPTVAPLLLQDFPQDIEAAARLTSWKPSVRVGQGEVSYVDAMLADNSLFTLFDFVWLEGEAATALQAPDSVVLTEASAQKLFGAANPLGKTLVLADTQTAKVTGVIADLPTTTHLKFDMLVPITVTSTLYGPKALDSWFSQNYHTYILLKQGASINALQQQFYGFLARHIDSDAAKMFSMEAMPLTDVHLYSNRRGEMGTPGSIVAVSAFSVIAVIVLLVACINFMNLATAKAAQRMREVGVRKAAGASKSSLVVQFLGESVLMAGIAMLVALAGVELALPAFNAMVQKELALQLLGSAVTLPLLLLLIVVVGVSAGAYPAFYIASYKPAAILRGQIAGGKGGVWLRSALVLVQFSVAIMLLICVATLYSQVQFARNMETGYNKEQIVVLSNLGRDGVGRQWDSMKRELLSHPDVLQVTAANSIPTRDIQTTYTINYEGGSERRSMPTMQVDFGFFETYGIQLLAGRFFSVNELMDRRTQAMPGVTPPSSTYIVSEEAARQLGWSPEQALGKWLEVTCCGMGQGLIAGVVNDVQYQSIHVPTGPALYLIPPEPGEVLTSETRLRLREIAIKLSGNNLASSLAHIDNTWNRFHPNQPITRFFLSDEFDSLYQAEERQGRMLISFALLAIFITCLGLYGLSCFNAERRRKEIGVRKVMGGSVWSIVVLLTNDFSRLVLLSNLIAWPVAYVVMNLWLENFAYRIDLTPLIFIGSGLIALCIAWVTVGGIAAKAANAKPVLALRYE